MKRQTHPCIDVLRDPRTAVEFSRQVITNFSALKSESTSLHANQMHSFLKQSFLTVSSNSLPVRRAQRKQVWISDSTLTLIDKRQAARLEEDWETEKELSIIIRKSSRSDRQEWLRSLAGTGNWKSAKYLRKPPKSSQGRLKNIAGELVFSDARAETMAEYLEKIQWRVRPSALVLERQSIWSMLEVELGDIQVSEVYQAVKKLKYSKAAGCDNIAPEFFKALVSTSEELQLITDLCQLCWASKEVPYEWQVARVVAIFKKGDPAECANYRPISLLCIGYKLLASILLERLKQAGAEERIWSTQFGFKSGSGTADTLYLSRRLLDRIWAGSDSCGILLALDWAKAFDSLSPASLADALKRFGIPTSFIEMIHHIYNGRQFFVRDGDVTSKKHTQYFGISQGCPLSPFLFNHSDDYINRSCS